MASLSNSIKENIKRIKADIEEAALKSGRDPADIRLMAVTKTVSAENVNTAIEEGITLLGENRAQELLEKYGDYIKEGTEIHFIGHLQRNKVKQIIDKVDMIQSVDSLKLLAEIDKEAGKIGKVMDYLVEVNIGGEESKNGISKDNLHEFIKNASQFKNASFKGLMTIPPVFSETEGKQYFKAMQELFHSLSGQGLLLSMGMSGDYKTAIKYGSNIIRIGTALFGSRF